MNPQIGRAGFLIGAFILVAGVPLLFFTQPGTAEFAITLFTVLLGVVFLVGVAVAAHMSKR